MKFSKETKDRLRLNPNVKEVYQSTIPYAEDFKQKALYEYELGKHPREIFAEAGFDLSLIDLTTSIPPCKILKICYNNNRCIKNMGGLK